MKKWIPIASGLMAGFVAATISFADFSKNTNSELSSATNKSDAEKVYVPFGEKDDYYLFASGGHSGQMFIYGVPSMRQIRTVPVFSQDSATGYGFDEHSKEMMGAIHGETFTTRLFQKLMAIMTVNTCLQPMSEIAVQRLWTLKPLQQRIS